MPALRQDVPWDVIAAIIDVADITTLKQLSLVCRDFCVESAPALCRCFMICAKPHGAGVSSLLMQSQTQILRNHSRLRYIKSVHMIIHSYRGRTRWFDDYPQPSGPLYSLFLAIQCIEQLESLDLEILDRDAEFMCCLRNIPLPLSLSHLRICTTNDSSALHLGPRFWQLHGAHLRSLKVSGPSMTATELPVALPSLQRLHIRNPNPAYFRIMPAPLRALVVERIRDWDIDAAENWPGMVPTGVGASSSPPSMWSTLEEFEFGYRGALDSVHPYMTLITHMPNLRRLVVRHKAFASTGSLIQAIAIIKCLPDLQEFAWHIPNQFFEGGRVVAGDQGNIRVRCSEVAEYLKDSRSLRRLILHFQEVVISPAHPELLSVGQHVRLVYTRRAPRSPWVIEA